MEASTAVARTATKKELEVAWTAITTGELPDGFGASGDARGTALAIVDRIKSSDSFEDVFNPQELPAWRDTYLGVPVLVRDLHLNKSTVAGEGAAVYAVVDIEPLDGQAPATVSCGGQNVLAQLLKILENGWWDKPVKMIAKRTAEGYDALWLVSAEGIST